MYSKSNIDNDLGKNEHSVWSQINNGIVAAPRAGITNTALNCWKRMTLPQPFFVRWITIVTDNDWGKPDKTPWRRSARFLAAIGAE